MARWFTEDIGMGMEVYKDSRGKPCLECKDTAGGHNPTFEIPADYVGVSGWQNEYQLCYECAMRMMYKQSGGKGKIGKARELLKKWMHNYRKSLPKTLVPGSIAVLKSNGTFFWNGREWKIRKGVHIVMNERIEKLLGEMYGFTFLRKRKTYPYCGMISGDLLTKVGHKITPWPKKSRSISRDYMED